MLPLLTGAQRGVPQSADPESTKSPQWLMNPSPQQQPQSTTFADDHPDSSSNKDATVGVAGGQAPSARNKILIQLLRQEDKDEDESAEADPGLLLNPAKQNRAAGSVSVLTALAKLGGVQNHHQEQQQQPAVVSALPDTSASPRDQERDVEPTSNSGTGSSNNLLKVSKIRWQSYLPFLFFICRVF